jgi:hypothetical protein
VIVGVFGITFVVSDVLSREALQGEATHFWKRLAENPGQAVRGNLDPIVLCADRAAVAAQSRQRQISGRPRTRAFGALIINPVNDAKDKDFLADLVNTIRSESVDRAS